MLQEHVQAQMSLVLSATFDMNQNFWRGVLNRRQVDYGFVYGLLGFVLRIVEVTYIRIAGNCQVSQTP